MDESRDQDLNEINDEQERLHFQLSSKRDNDRLNSQQVREQFHELIILQLLLYFLIITGIVSLFVLVLINIHLIIIIIDFGVVIVYFIYLKYITQKFRKILKITKREYKGFFKIKTKGRIISILKIIFNFIIILITILILIDISLSLKLDPLIIVIVISVSLIYFFFDKDFKD